MSKTFFTRLGLTPLLLITVAAVFTSSAWAREPLWPWADVPFLVNVDATVTAQPIKYGQCPILRGGQITVTANQVDTMHLEELLCLDVQYGAQRQTNVPAIVSNLGGKVTVNLPAQSYKNAEISLYTVNGKRILRNNVSASSAVNCISRPNIATGVYLLSVKGTDGYAVTSRLTLGGGLNINVFFGNISENLSAVPQMAKKADDDMPWDLPLRITVSASVAGYKDCVYIFQPVTGENALQNITLLFAND